MGVITSVGTIDICSKLVLIKPIKKPNKANVKATSTNKKIIRNGYITETSTKKVEVIKINTILSKPKTKIVKGKLGKKTGYKKAIVTLAEGNTIDSSLEIK